MNSDDHRDQLIDMLLREVVGGESPPDVRERVLDAVSKPTQAPRLLTATNTIPIALPSSRPSRTPHYAIAAILILTAVCLGFMYFQSIAKARTPVLTSVSGTVSRSTGPLHSGDIIQTGTESTATLVYLDGTLVKLEAESSLQIPELSLTNRSKTLEINKGGIRASVAPQGSEYPMTLSSPHARAIVVGTKLSFITSSERTRLEVTEGTVRLETKSMINPITVNAGEFAEADDTEHSRSGLINPPSTPTITGFTLMNADTDQPISTRILKSGQTISLSTLPTKRISLRAEISGSRPVNVRFAATRFDGKDTGLEKLAPQSHPPYFLSGDYSEGKRPADARPWTPKPGKYRISAVPSYRTQQVKKYGAACEIVLIFTR